MGHYCTPIHILQILFNGGVFATGIDGVAVADVPLSTGRVGVNYMDIDSIIVPIKVGKSMIGRPAMGKKLGTPVFSLSVPMRNTQGKVIGVLVGVTILQQSSFLDVITDNRYGKTGGYLLVAPQYRLIVTATEKRLVMTQSPPPGADKLIDRFIQGYEGTGVLVNSLGLEMLSSAKRVPVAGWYVVAALPTAEAFAPIHKIQSHILWAAIILTMFAGGLTWWMLRRLLSPLFTTVAAISAMTDTNQQPQPLAVDRNDEIGNLISAFNCLLETSALREENYRAIFDHAAVGIMRATPDGRIVEVNDKLCSILEFTSDELCATSFKEIIYPDDVPVSVHGVSQMLAGQISTYATEKRYVNKSGGIVWGNATLSLTHNADGTPKFFIAVIEDILKRKKAEIEREDALNLLQKIASRVPGILYQYRLRPDGSSCFPYLSEATRMFFRVGPEEAIEDGFKIFSMIHPDDYDGVIVSIRTSARDLTLWRHEYRVTFDDGTMRWLFGDSIPEREKDGSVLWHGFLTDITDRKQMEMSLCESEQKFKAIANYAASWEAWFSPAGKLIWINRYSRVLTGFTPEECLAAEDFLAMVIAEENIATVRGKFQEAMQGSSDSMEIIFLRKDGSRFWGSVFWQPILDATGCSLGFRTSAQDITKRKKSEESLNEVRQKLSHAMRMVQLFEWEYDVINGFFLFSDHYFTLHGTTSELEGGNTMSAEVFAAKFVHPDDASMVGEELAKAVSTADPDYYAQSKTRIFCRDGTVKYVSVHVSVTKDAAGRTITISGANLDITKRTLLEAERDRMVAIIEATPDMVGIADPDGLHLYANKACRAVLLCVGTDEDITKTVITEFHANLASNPTLTEGIPTAIRTGIWSGESCMQSRTGRVIPVSQVLIAHKSSNGKLECISTIMRDITENKRVENELQAKNRELESFNYTVSHDLKSPLITIQTYAGMILNDIETGKLAHVHDDLKSIESAAGKMTALLDDLLALSRSGQTMGTTVQVDMNSVINNTLLQLAGPLKLSHAEVVVQPKLPAVFGDQKRIAEVVQNLIENAIKYRGGQSLPRIEIGTRQDVTECVFFVSDNGKGIDPLHHERIFGLFNKLDAKSEGSGVGLALVKRIIKAHGGRVWVESEGVGMGSRFCFTVGEKW